MTWWRCKNVYCGVEYWRCSRDALDGATERHQSIEGMWHLRFLMLCNGKKQLVGLAFASFLISQPLRSNSPTFTVQSARNAHARPTCMVGCELKLITSRHQLRLVVNLHADFSRLNFEFLFVLCSSCIFFLFYDDEKHISPFRQKSSFKNSLCRCFWGEFGEFCAQKINRSRWKFIKNIVKRRGGRDGWTHKTVFPPIKI